MILQSDKVVWYHPFNAWVDSGGHAWASGYNSVHPSWGGTLSIAPGGKLGNHCARSGGPAWGCAGVEVGGKSLAGESRTTFAAWLDFSSSGAAVIGCGFDSVLDWDDYIGSLQGPLIRENGQVQLFVGDVEGVLEIAPVGTIPTTKGSWHLYVIDLEYTGGAWTLRWSKDGSDWATSPSAPVSGDPFDGPGGGEMIVSGNNTALDEVVVWADTELFTSEELQNLYDLADVFGDGMDAYGENYEAPPICWQATATMLDGTVWRDSGSGPCPAVIRVPRGSEDIVVTDDGKQVRPRIVEG